MAFAEQMEKKQPTNWILNRVTIPTQNLDSLQGCHTLNKNINHPQTPLPLHLPSVTRQPHPHPPPTSWRPEAWGCCLGWRRCLWIGRLQGLAGWARKEAWQLGCGHSSTEGLGGPGWIYWRWQDGICRADVTCCHDSGSLLSVCGDSWFILGAMIVPVPQMCSPTQPQTLISLTWARWGCKPAINNTLHSCILKNNLLVSGFLQHWQVKRHNSKS